METMDKDSPEQQILKEKSDDVITLSDTEMETCEMLQIVDVSMINGKLQYRIQWVAGDQTWETEDSFTSEVSVRHLEIFKVENKDKIDRILKAEANKTQKKEKNKTEEIDFEEDNEEEELGNILAPRELTENDSFYGKPVKELQGESKRLFDPTHKQTTTDLLLATYAGSEGRISRSKAAELKKAASEAGSVEHSRSNTPTVSKKKVTKRERKPRKKVQKYVDDDDEEEETNEEEEDEDDDEMPTKYAKQGKKPGRKATRGRPKKGKEPLKIIETSKEEEVPLNLNLIENNSKKRESNNKRETSAEKEMSQMRFSESPPPSSKPKFFIGRNDDSDNEDTWIPKTKITPSVSKISEVIHRGYEKMKCRYPNLIEAVLREDVVSARLIFNQSDPVLAQKQIVEYRDCNKMPILQKLISKIRQQKRGEASKSITLIRFILSFCRQSLLLKTESDGNFPIHEAIRLRNYELVKLFALCGSPIAKPNSFGIRPLDLAVVNRDLKIVEFLLHRGVTYHYLLSSSNQSQARKAVLSTPSLLNMLQHNNTQLISELTKTRRKLYKRNLRDLQAVSPVMIFPRRDGDIVEFEFDFTPPSKWDRINNGHFFTMFPVAYHSGKKQWISTVNNTKLAAAPKLNDRKLRHAHMILMPAVFFAVPKPGKNQIELRLQPYLFYNSKNEIAVACQMVKYDKRPATYHKHVLPKKRVFTK